MISGAPNKHGIFHQRPGVGGGEEDTTRDKFLNSGDRQMDALLGYRRTNQCFWRWWLIPTIPALARLNEEEN